MAGRNAGWRTTGRDPGTVPGDSADHIADESLARAVQQGDRDALEELVHRYVRPLHGVSAAFLKEPEEIEDAVQETFLRALAAIAQYDSGRPFAPWLYQIARNVARNRVAARSRWRMEPIPAGGLHSMDPAPDISTERAEIRARLELEMQRLPEQRRTAFRLVDVEGMTATEAARIMGVTSGTVRSHVHHARQALRGALVSYTDTPGSGEKGNSGSGQT